MVFEDYEKDEKYRAIFRKYGQKIKARINLLYQEYQDFIEGIQIPPESIHLQVELVFDVVRNYFVDLNRVKEFHDIEHANGLKIAAYQSSWLLRIKPIQINWVDTNHIGRYMLINEHFAFHTMISQLYNTNPLHKINDLNAWNEFNEHLIYHFRFRDTSPQTLELMLEATDVQSPWPKREGNTRR